jgi:hypothetical protein
VFKQIEEAAVARWPEEHWCTQLLSSFSFFLFFVVGAAVVVVVYSRKSFLLVPVFDRFIQAFVFDSPSKYSLPFSPRPSVHIHRKKHIHPHA